MSKCLLCGTDSLYEFLNLGNQPLANKYPTEKQFSTEDYYPLSVLFCTNCKNVQLGTIVSRERMFEDYYYLASVNEEMVRHFNKLADKLINSKFVVEIGSNDGILLKPLKERGIKALGVDPSINVGKMANDQGLETLVSFFDMDIVNKIKHQYGKPDVIVASSVFTHLENPHGVIEAVKELLTDDGKFIIEVEYIGNIIKNIQFERFYLDRIFYYSLNSLYQLFESHGMHIIDVEEIEPHGGSLQVVISKNNYFPSNNVIKILEDENNNILNINKLDSFRAQVNLQVSRLKTLLLEYKATDIKVAGYGAPARLTTICNYGNIGPDLIEFTVDDSPIKQNKYTPGTHIPIVSIDHLNNSNIDILVVFAYDYMPDIKEKTNNSYRYLMPIPPTEC